MRIERDDLYSGIAYLVSLRSTCPRRAVGAIIVKDNIIISMGYNGAPAGQKHCEAIGCDIDGERCIRAVHAEANAIAAAARNGISTKGATLYTTCGPCLDCAKLIINSGIERVLYEKRYRDERGVQLLAMSKIRCGTHIPTLTFHVVNRREDVGSELYHPEGLGLGPEESSTGFRTFSVPTSQKLDEDSYYEKRNSEKAIKESKTA